MELMNRKGAGTLKDLKEFLRVLLHSPHSHKDNACKDNACKDNAWVQQQMHVRQQRSSHKLSFLASSPKDSSGKGAAGDATQGGVADIVTKVRAKANPSHSCSTSPKPSSIAKPFTTSTLPLQLFDAFLHTAGTTVGSPGENFYRDMHAVQSCTTTQQDNQSVAATAAAAQSDIRHFENPRQGSRSHGATSPTRQYTSDAETKKNPQVCTPGQLLSLSAHGRQNLCRSYNLTVQAEDVATGGQGASAPVATPLTIAAQSKSDSKRRRVHASPNETYEDMGSHMHKAARSSVVDLSSLPDLFRKDKSNLARSPQPQATRPPVSECSDLAPMRTQPMDPMHALQPLTTRSPASAGAALPPMRSQPMDPLHALQPFASVRELVNQQLGRTLGRKDTASPGSHVSAIVATGVSFPDNLKHEPDACITGLQDAANASGTAADNQPHACARSIGHAVHAARSCIVNRRNKALDVSMAYDSLRMPTSALPIGQNFPVSLPVGLNLTSFPAANTPQIKNISEDLAHPKPITGPIPCNWVQHQSYDSQKGTLTAPFGECSHDSVQRVRGSQLTQNVSKSSPQDQNQIQQCRDSVAVAVATGGIAAVTCDDAAAAGLREIVLASGGMTAVPSAGTSDTCVHHTTPLHHCSSSGVHKSNTQMMEMLHHYAASGTQLQLLLVPASEIFGNHAETFRPVQVFPAEEWQDFFYVIQHDLNFSRLV